MKELLSLNGNKLFEDAEGKKPIYEIVIITTEPVYELTNGFDLVKKRKTEEIRFFAREEHLEKLSEQLLELKALRNEDSKEKTDSQK